MACKICRHSDHAEMIVAYAKTGSYRKVADLYGVSFKTLQRHIRHCVYAVMEEAEEADYQMLLSYLTQLLTWEYSPSKQNRRSIVTKPVEWTWSRRSWKKKR